MINMKKISILALALLIVGTIGGLLTFRSTQKIVNVSEKKEITQSFTSLNVNINNGIVEVIPTKNLETRVEVRGKTSTYSENKFFAKVQDKKLVVKLTEQKRKFYNFDFFSSPLSLKLYVPEKQYESLQVYCNNGRINVANLNVNRIKARTDNGRIHLSNISSTNADVVSSNGEISLKDVDGKITGSTDNGRISLAAKNIDRPIQFYTDNGSIDIKTEEAPTNVRFDVHVDNGSINILDKYKTSTVIGNGKNLIKLSTDNGRISVTK